MRTTIRNLKQIIKEEVQKCLFEMYSECPCGIDRNMCDYHKPEGSATTATHYIDLDCVLDGFTGPANFIEHVKSNYKLDIKLKSTNGPAHVPEFRFSGDPEEIKRYLNEYTDGDRQEIEYLADEFIKEL